MESGGVLGASIWLWFVDPEELFGLRGVHQTLKGPITNDLVFKPQL